MLTMKNTVAPLMGALFLTTAMAGFAQAQGKNPCGSDGSGDVPIKPCPEAAIEAQADAAVMKPKDMVGDYDGDEPLTKAQQVRGSAPSGAAPTGDLSGEEPTNQPIIDTTEGND